MVLALVLAVLWRRPAIFVGTGFGGAVLGTVYGFVVLQLVSRLEHARDDDAERRDERDPEPDAASGGDDRERHPDQR